jgi:hypothetical protein
MLELRADRTMMRREVSGVLRDALVERCPGVIPTDNDTTPLYTLLKQAGEEVWREQFDPYQVLANLRCPLFVNAVPDVLLEVALEKLGKQPHIVICPWSSELQWANGAFAPDDPALNASGAEHMTSHLKVHRRFEPDIHSPIIYHPFGLFQLLSSLVLTEDDYFQYLVGSTKNQTMMLPAVRYRLTASALLFIGFRLDDWGFRTLIREILQLEGHALSREFTHVAVQIDPATSPGTAERSVEYLEQQFKAYNITVYWGSTTEFMRQLEEEYLLRMQTPLRSRIVGHYSAGQSS